MVADQFARPLPECPIYQFRDDVPTKRLLAVCQALQGYDGDEPIFLSRRLASALSGLVERTASNRRKSFVEAGILELVAVGEPDRKKRVASTYRYLATSPNSQANAKNHQLHGRDSIAAEPLPT